MIRILLIIFISLPNFQFFTNRKQSVQIRGVFRCGQEIPRNATIELWDEDQPLQNFIYHYMRQKKSMDPDDRLSMVHPNDDGTFIISATHAELAKLSLYVVVYHQCDHLEHFAYNHFTDKRFQKWRRFIFRIPNEYVNDGDQAERIFDLGIWNLQLKFLEEEGIISCSNSSFQHCPSVFPYYSPYLNLLWKNLHLPAWW